MPRVSSKHKETAKAFRFRGFDAGLNTDTLPPFLGVKGLSKCKNLKFIIGKDDAGEPIVIAKQRQGTVKISNSALPSSADVEACTYFANQEQYILGTSSKLYYLDGSLDPVEIGDLDGLPTFTEFHNKLIIHDTGVTKAWDGTTFETLNCYHVEESLGTGDNIETQFTGTLDHPPVETSSITITYTDATTKTITDDGAGNLIGDVDAGGNNTITYATGVYDFTCSGAPDDGTSILINYEEDEGAPKSHAGMVRASRLYLCGDSDNSSRHWYSGPNDEDGWDTSSGGGYLDVRPNDGYDLEAILNYFDMVILIKRNSVYKLNDFPGDSTFGIEPLFDKLGTTSYRTAVSDGGITSFLTDGGWATILPTEEFGDLRMSVTLSSPFSTQAVRFANASAYSQYNQHDQQLWLTLYDEDNSVYLPQIFVVSLATGGQLSYYEFEFGHSSYQFVNGMMLIGGSDGNLYRLDDTDTIFEDDSVSYSDNTYIRSAFTDWGLPFNRKHNKMVDVGLDATLGTTANLKLFKDRHYTEFDTIALEAPIGDAEIYSDGQDVEIYDLQNLGISPVGQTDFSFKNRFNYRDIMWEISDINSLHGAEVSGVDFTGAILGDLGD